MIFVLSFLGTVDTSRSDNIPGSYIWDCGTIQTCFSMMLNGSRYGDYVNEHAIGGVIISREDWNRLHTTFVEQGLHPVFLKGLDLAWDIVFLRPVDAIGSWKRLFVLCDGFWSQKPKKNHVGDSDHGSMLLVDGINGLILSYGMVSRLDDKVNGIKGVNMYSQSMEPFLFEQMLNELKTSGFVVEVTGKDGDIGAPEVLKRVFRLGSVSRCWIHGHRTVYKDVPAIPKKYVKEACKACKQKNANLQTCTHYGKKERCGCPLNASGNTIDHKPIDSSNGIANRAQAAIANVFVHLHRTYPTFIHGEPNPDFPSTKVVRQLCLDKVNVVLDHFFNRSHKACHIGEDSNHPDLDAYGLVPKDKIRAGHYITCESQQKDFEDIVKKKLGLLHLNKPHGLWNDTVGLCTTNWVETAIGYIARIRLKSLKYLPEENREREELGVVKQQSVRLGRLGVDFVPEVEILKRLEKVMKLKKGSLIDKRTELFLKKDLANRIKKANTQTSKEYRERKHQQKLKKKNNKKNGKKSGSVEDYDNDHNKNLHNDEIDLTTTAVDVLAAAVKTSKKRKKKNYKCSICGKTNDHNKSKCPQVAAMNNTNTNKRTKTN
jgi:hypothetical protein|tara:strand:- start:758 stop:2560 length:1803 start_codon:yes stop_codon:yes gene_type:complete